MKNFSSLKDLLKIQAKEKGIAHKVQNTLILEEFHKIAEKIWDKEVASEMKALYIKDNILTVAVLNSVLAQEIKMRENLLLAELSRKTGKKKINAIRTII